MGPLNQHDSVFFILGPPVCLDPFQRMGKSSITAVPCQARFSPPSESLSFFPCLSNAALEPAQLGKTFAVMFTSMEVGCKIVSLCILD